MGVAQWLSIDVALGAICSCAMMYKVMGVTPLPWYQLLILGGTIQLIYTLDHLWDVQHMQMVPITERHIFHWRFKPQLWIFAGILTIILGLAAIFLLPSLLIYFGLGLGSIVALYLWLVNYLPLIKAMPWFHKEIFIAFIYTAGICGVPLLQAPHITIVHSLLIGCFGLVAFQNLLLFSYYELEEDILQAQRSVVQVWGVARTKTILLLSFFVFYLGIGIAYALNYNSAINQVLVICSIMSGTLLVLFCFPAYFKVNHNYRKIGDGIFLMPGGLLLYEILFF
jgi:hypothetical protein